MTAQEDISLPLGPDDIRPTSVTLRWIPGRVINQIKLEPGGIIHAVTAEEVAAGAANIEGLTGSTKYTATLNGTKVRTTITLKLYLI